MQTLAQLGLLLCANAFLVLQPDPIVQNDPADASLHKTIETVDTDLLDTYETPASLSTEASFHSINSISTNEDEQPNLLESMQSLHVLDLWTDDRMELFYEAAYIYYTDPSNINLRVLFDTVDEDRDGGLTQTEFLALLISLNEESLVKVFKKTDTDGSLGLNMKDAVIRLFRILAAP